MKSYLGFWEQLQKPFFVLAPMANVTDVVFRRMIAKYGRPDVMWTEFVSADGLCHPKGRQALLRDLEYVECERPIVTQLFTAHPEKMYEAAKFVASLGFDGIDINMGCPDKNVMKQGAGASLMKDPALAQAVILAAMEGVEASGKRIPVSVKTRLGFNEDTLDEWLPKLLETKPAVITVHCRTKKEMSKVPAKWERVKRAVEIARGSGTLIVGNGDVRDCADAEEKARETGCDGVMLGRAVFGNPWLFDRKKQDVTVREKLEVAIEHTKLFEETWRDTKSFDLMKKHYQAYINHFPLAKELRVELMICQNAEDVKKSIEKFLKTHGDIAA
ncbi:MAG: tRNA-dihydrouridine synthase [Candidatus Moranbacteria bacterium]|nr:tRNA-dihydrouridine synthase [Candidatus Moranbacteria bacterium]